MAFIALPVKVPAIIKLFYRNYIWDKFRETGSEKVIYLTFDDGPIPEVTPWVLDLLNEFNAKATFFCIGENVVRHPGIFKKVLESGNTIANHTYNHLKGWGTEAEEYVANVLEAEEILKKSAQIPLKSTVEQVFLKPKMLRPPYGKITKKQAKQLKSQDYEIIMYDVIAYDWDHNIPAEKCIENITHHAKPGSIVVFHDSLKAERNLKIALPEVLKYYKKKGYKFKAL
ncbi:MAG: polysaccharide deacetylase family protein [Leeuwenhoekiella sp.]